MSSFDFAVVVPVFNKRAMLGISLNSLLEAVHPGVMAEIICIDHGSTDSSREFLLGQPGIRVLGIRGGNIGFLRNEGARRSAAPILVFVDSDVVVPPGYFDRVRQALEESGAEAVGCEYGLPAHPHWTETAWYHLTVRRGDGPRHYLNAGNFAVRREAFEAVGGFSEVLETGEDTDLCRRLTAAGFRIEQRQALEAAHLGNPKSLLGFYRKQVWHGLGSLDAARPGRPDLTISGTIAWAATTGLGLATAVVALSQRSPWLLAMALGLLLAAPGATLLFRAWRNSRLPPVLRGLLLVWVFYCARFTALLRVSRRRRRVVAALQPVVEELR